MEENEFEFDGKIYSAKEYPEDDCGFLGGTSCAFNKMSLKECSKFKCTPDKRLDSRNVIFVEKQQ